MALLTTTLLVTVLRIVDGDTFIVSAANCASPVLCDNVSVRLADVDTPELSSHCQLASTKAQEAKQLLAARLPVFTEINLTVYTHKDKYGRLLAVLPDIAAELKSKGLAVPYKGQKKTFDWCKVQSV